MELSIILPCRNEEKAIALCIKQIKEIIKKERINAEIIVSDSSSDSSPEIAQSLGVKVVKHNKEGYGNAYLEGIKQAKGKYLFMADADGTYEFKEIPRFLNELKKGANIVIGNRFQGEIEKNAMPWHHRYIGNPFLSALLRFLFNSKVQDVHSGMRAISKQTFNSLNLKTTGMEFASEMIIQSSKRKLKIKQLPINYKKRIGDSKLKSFSDGWRHLRFMLLYSPIFLFLVPGIILFIAGIITMFLLYTGNFSFLNIKFQYHPMFLSSLLIIIGYQIIIFAFFAKAFAITHLNERDRLVSKLMKYITIEKAGITGIILSLIGIIIYLLIFIRWIKTGFGALAEVKNSLLALTLAILGVQTFFSAFMLSMLGIKEK